MASEPQNTEQTLAAAHKALRSTPGIQFDFQAAAPEQTPGWAKALMALIEAAAPVLVYVFWGGVILGALLILAFIIHELRPSGRRARVELATVDWRPEPEKARVLLEHADRLAAEGRYAEAIRLLLFRSIDDLAGRRPGLVKPALTSRDIAALDALPEAPRGAFGRLAHTVERTLFGGGEAGAEAFARARSDYEAFAFAEAWR